MQGAPQDSTLIGRSRERPSDRAPARLPAVLVAALLSSVPAAGCASGASGAPGAGAGPDAEAAGTADTAQSQGTAGAAEGDARSTAELEAIYRARTDSARARFTEADVHFMTGMIVHHGQALVMSALARDRAASPQLRTLAARIANSQRDEIATMQRWLRERGLPVPEVEIEGSEMRVRGLEEDHPRHMPGMLTPEQLRELEAAQGPEFDRLFLRYMIQHHQGAVDMVRTLFATDGAAQNEATFRLASDIQVDQLTEIARMEGMLERLPAIGGGS